MVNCIRAADYATTEITPEDAGYTVENPEGGRFEVALHVVEIISAEESSFMGLIKTQVQRAVPVCVIRFSGSSWWIHASEVYSTEKLSDLYRHLQYFNMDIRLEGITTEVLAKVYREAREERPGATDRRT
jgi:hypothetical protein